MYIGALEVRLRLRESRSLKDKRQVLRSIIDRLRGQFNVSVAEVDARDQWQLAVLGFAQAGEEAAGVKASLDQIANALRRHPIAVFLSCSIWVDRALLDERG